MQSMTNAAITPAPSWRRMVAGLLDAALLGGGHWLLGRRAPHRAAGLTALLRLVDQPLRQQLGSPGQRLLGLRTVDRRTGRRLDLWRSLVLLAAGSGGQAIARRFGPRRTAEQKHKQERFVAEVREIHQRHPEGSPGREAEMEALFEHPPTPMTANAWTSVAPMLGVGLLNAVLRRRLAPTTEVLVRRGR
jgi:hypothetical protein